MDGFRNEDEAIQHWLARLRDGSAEERVTARTELALILERRGLIDDAIEGYRTNVEAGARDRRSYDRLAALYRARGDVVAEAAVVEQLGQMLRDSESQTMTDLPTMSRAPAPSMPATRSSAEPGLPTPPDSGGVLHGHDDPDPYPGQPLGADPRPLARMPDPAEQLVPDHDAVDRRPSEPIEPPAAAYATETRRARRPVGPPGAAPARRGATITPAAGVLVALLGLLVLIAAVVFAMLWSGGRIGVSSSGGAGSGLSAGTAAEGGATTPAAQATGTSSASLAAGPEPTPTRAASAAACWDPAVRFPESQQPAESVRRALLEHLERQDGAVDPDNPQVKSLVDAHVARADELVAGWMGVQLQRAQRRLPLFSLTSYIGSELLVPNEVGQYTMRPTISEQGWREIQAWSADSCEGAFVTRPENAAWVTSMRASVGDISWAQAVPSPGPSPSPSPGSR